MMIELAQECLEPESIELVRMYGTPKKLQTVFHMHSARHQRINYHLSTKARDVVLKRLDDYGGTKQRRSQLLDKEQQRGLEQELKEERQLERPPPVAQCELILYKEISRLTDIHSDIVNLWQYPLVFQTLTHASIGTTFFSEYQPESCQRNLWISTEFQRVILTKEESLNSFPRPTPWIRSEILEGDQCRIFLGLFCGYKDFVNFECRTNESKLIY